MLCEGKQGRKGHGVTEAEATIMEVREASQKAGKGRSLACHCSRQREEDVHRPCERNTHALSKYHQETNPAKRDQREGRRG